MANGVTEFCCRSGGSNLNAGTLQGDSTEPGTSASASYEYGDWDASTGVFTSNDEDPLSDGVAVGDYVSLYEEYDTVTGFVGQVTAVDYYEMTIDITDHYAGTIPSSSSGSVFANVGGAWQGPNGAEGFPLDFVEDRMADGSDVMVRVNLKNDQTYSITAEIAMPTDNYRTIQGYSSSYADKGEALIQGPATGTSFTLLEVQNVNATGNFLVDLHFDQNGNAAGSDYGVEFFCGNQRSWMIRCRFSNMYRDGLRIGDSDAVLIDCESYDNGRYGIHNTVGNNVKLHNCRIHNNTSTGYYTAPGQNRYGVFDSCIFAFNGGDGLAVAQDSGSMVVNCVFFGNTSDGLFIKGSPVSFVRDCAFFDNGAYGINFNAPDPTWGHFQLVNCAFGAGTLANGSGTHNKTSGTYPTFNQVGTVTETTDFDPFEDSANGDFTLKSDSLMVRAGFNFTQRNTGFDGTTSNRSIGATGPPAGGGGGGIQIARGMHGGMRG